MNKPAPIASITFLILFISLNATLPSNSLDKFLNSNNISDRKAAYLEILKNKEAYIDQIQQGLEAFQGSKNQRFDILNRLLYLAAIIRSEKFIDPLWKMINDFHYLGDECIYCCPIVLSLTLYGVYANWSPPAELANSRSSMLSDLNSWIRSGRQNKNTPLFRGHSGIQFASPEKQEWLAKIELLSEEELIKMTSPENSDRDQRYFASDVLANTVVDDTNLMDLYWLAIEEITNDTSGEYRCNIYTAILRAERARAQSFVERR
jgi:hypothetical protein